MPTQSELESRMSAKSDADLLKMIERPHDWTPEALSVAKAELQRRGVNPSQSSNDSVPTELQLLRLTDAEIFSLQKTSNYYTFNNVTKTRAVGSLLWGLIAIVTGFSSMGQMPVNIILGFIGILLILEGALLLMLPKPWVLFVDGLVLWILAVWHTFVSFHSMASNGLWWQLLGALGIWQFIWGCQSLEWSRRFSKMEMLKPTKLASNMIERIVAEVIAASDRGFPNVIRFQAKAFTANQQWKGILENGLASFVETGRDDLGEVLIAKQGDLEMVCRGSCKYGENLKATISICNRRLRALISPNDFERYEAWKGIVPSERVSSRPSKSSLCGYSVLALSFSPVPIWGAILAIIALVKIANGHGRMRGKPLALTALIVNLIITGFLIVGIATSTPK